MKLEVERKKRAGDISSFDNLLFEIMEESNIKKQHFQCGSMNGVCCRRLLDETDVIFEKIQLLVKDKVSKRKIDDNKKYVPLSELTKVLGTFKSLFECIDLVFCKLRILDPTVEEIEKNCNKGVRTSLD